MKVELLPPKGNTTLSPHPVKSAAGIHWEAEKKIKKAKLAPKKPKETEVHPGAGKLFIIQNASKL
ncbi:MAG: hypothetical protein DME22_18475 [Verrucomicrobia bacterium]|nr:MAG: hypothetical protein DME22_18475 [Verrucomicrobiota bacterium]